MSPRRGKPGRQLAPLKAKTIHALQTKQRVHAIVGQVLEELEARRAKGKNDYVAALADEVEKGGLAAWKALRDLLPRDDIEVPPGSIGTMAGATFAGIFAGAAAQAAAMDRAKATEPDDNALPIIDVRAEPVTATENQKRKPVGRNEPIDW
jgi:hypothetical protein